jgi:ATP-dependent RNA helicase DeaD
VPERLRELAALGEVLLLIPPGTDAFVGRLAPNRRPVHARGLLDKAQGDLDSDRRSIAAALSLGRPRRPFRRLAPLLERYEATAVAAALLELWTAARTGAPEPAPPPAGASSGTVRIWVGVGKKDMATPHDLVGLLVKEVGVPRESVGKVELRDAFSLVELKGVADPEQVAERMAGKMIRKRRWWPGGPGQAVSG